MDGVSLIVDYEIASATVPAMGPVAMLVALVALGGLGYRLQQRGRAARVRRG